MKVSLLLLSSFFLTIFNCEHGEDFFDSPKHSNRSEITINPIEQATAVVEWREKVIYLDPTLGAASFNEFKTPDIVFITDIHGDHLSIETLDGLNLDDIPIVVPQAVADLLPDTYSEQLIIMNNDDVQQILGFEITAIPMYNIREGVTNHIIGRGNGYVIESKKKRLYIAGDTEDTQEFRSLKNIDIALVPMNLPFTMPVENAADGVLEMQPKIVYPFHYRNQGGTLSDVTKFKELVNAGNPEIEVIQLDWYPDID